MSFTEVLAGTFVTSFWTFVYKQKITSCYSMKSPLFPPDCGKALLVRAMPWSAPEAFYSVVIQGGHSGSLAGLPHLLYDLSSFSPSLVAVCYVLPKKLGPPFSYYTSDGWKQQFKNVSRLLSPPENQIGVRTWNLHI